MNENQNSNNSNDTYENSEAPKPITPPGGVLQGKAPIGSITSPCESDRYVMALRDYAATMQVEGSLVSLDFTERSAEGEDIEKTVLCQVAKTRLSNNHHENPVLRALLREKGYISGLSGYADHKEVDLLPMDSIITGTEIHQLPRNIPPTGTSVRYTTTEDVKLFSGNHRALFNIGYLYETKVPVGLMLKHFGQDDDGWGDARMLGVFGGTGSGKTVMAGSVVAGFAARPEMGMLILDPQSQFSGVDAHGDYTGELGAKPHKWSWKLSEAFRLAGRSSDVTFVKIHEISLESPYLFANLLEKNGFLDNLGVKSAQKRFEVISDIKEFLKDGLKGQKKITPTFSLGDLTWDPINMPPAFCQIAASAYADAANKYNDFLNRYNSTPLVQTKAARIWEKVRNMFGQSYKLEQLLDDVLINRKIVILNVDTDESEKDLYLSEVLTGIKKKAEEIYRVQQRQPRNTDNFKKYVNAKTNALIVIDEAHRVAPQVTGSNEEQERLLSSLKDAIATTRKLSVGWFYITQSIARFNKDVFRQIQTKILGVGIGTGADNEHLETALSHDKDIINRYRRLPRPITTNVYPYAIIGELVALGNGSRALFVSAFETQEKLFEVNPDHFKHVNDPPIGANARKGIGSGSKALPAPVAALPPADDDIDF